MDPTSTCNICGNEVESTLTSCPFCREKREPVYSGKYSGQLRLVNLEKGMPVVQDALRLLKSELHIAMKSGPKVLVLIHGYGSSGKGGAIKEAVHRELQLLLNRKELNDVLPGEHCGKQSGHARHIMKRFPFAEEYVTRVNPGITVVII